MNPAPSKAPAIMATIGAVTQIWPVIGAVRSIAGGLEPFKDATFNGVGDPAVLSAAIGEVLISMAVGVLFGLVGIILLVISITYGRYRAPWLYWFLTFYGGLLTLAFPFGTPFGLYFVIFSQKKRSEFFTRIATPL